MISARFAGIPETVENLGVKIPMRVNQNLQRSMLRQVISLQRYIILNKLEGNPLHHRTGRLERAINYNVRTEGATVIGIVGVDTTAPYGAVHEKGGTVSVREQLRRSKLGKEFTVKAHTATYPKRAFLSPSLSENEDSIVEGLQQNLLEA